MAGSLAVMVFTDPPYNVAYEGKGDRRPASNRCIVNDNLGREFENFLGQACTNMLVWCGQQINQYQGPCERA